MFQSEFIKAKHLTETLKKENQDYKVRIYFEKLFSFKLNLEYISINEKRTRR
jgi:hypothetical protein